MDLGIRGVEGLGFRGGLGFRKLRPLGFRALRAVVRRGSAVFFYLSLQQKSNKSLALTYFLSVYYGPGVTVAMNVHIELYHNGSLHIEGIHIELFHTERDFTLSYFT